MGQAQVLIPCTYGYLSLAWVKPRYIFLAWVKPRYLSLTWVEPRYLSLAWVKPRYLSLTWVKPRYLSLVWVKPRYLSLAWVKPRLTAYLSHQQANNHSTSRSGLQSLFPSLLFSFFLTAYTERQSVPDLFRPHAGDVQEVFCGGAVEHDRRPVLELHPQELCWGVAAHDLAVLPQLGWGESVAFCAQAWAHVLHHLQTAGTVGVKFKHGYQWVKVNEVTAGTGRECSALCTGLGTHPANSGISQVKIKLGGANGSRSTEIKAGTGRECSAAFTDLGTCPPPPAYSGNIGVKVKQGYQWVNVKVTAGTGRECSTPCTGPDTCSTFSTTCKHWQ